VGCEAEEAEADLEWRRLRALFEICSRSFEGRRIERCDGGMLLSLGLLSARALLLSWAIAHELCRGRYFGMRLDVNRGLEEFDVLLVNEGNDGAGEPDDRGWETQSSESESSHAWSIVM
jgi:hypothetical protein